MEANSLKNLTNEHSSLGSVQDRKLSTLQSTQGITGREFPLMTSQRDSLPDAPARLLTRDSSCSFQVVGDYSVDNYRC